MPMHIIDWLLVGCGVFERDSRSHVVVPSAAEVCTGTGAVAIGMASTTAGCAVVTASIGFSTAGCAVVTASMVFDLQTSEFGVNVK